MSLSKRLISTDAAGGADATANFAPVIYTGNGSTQSISSLSFAPDLVWFKNRTGTNDHALVDSVRGRGSYLFANADYGASTGGSASNDVTSFDSNGFSLGSVSQAGSTNTSGGSIVAWCWKAAASTTTISAGTVGNDDASNVRANTAAGFSIVEWSSSGGARTVAHGLNSAPELIIIKKTASTSPWSVYATAVGNDKRLQLNEHDAAATDNMWNNTHPTSVVFTQQISGGATTDNIGYCFHSVAGYQKIGTYTGNTSSYPRVYTTDDGTSTGTNGFMPRFLMIKNYSAAYNWAIYDNAREPITSEGQSREKQLYPNTSQIENGNLFGDPPGRIDFYNDGFQLQAALGNINQNGGSFIYLAIA